MKAAPLAGLAFPDPKVPADRTAMPVLKDRLGKTDAMVMLDLTAEWASKACLVWLGATATTDLVETRATLAVTAAQLRMVLMALLGVLAAMDNLVLTVSRAKKEPPADLARPVCLAMLATLGAWAAKARLAWTVPTGATEMTVHLEDLVVKAGKALMGVLDPLALAVIWALTA